MSEQRIKLMRVRFEPSGEERDLYDGDLEQLAKGGWPPGEHTMVHAFWYNQVPQLKAFPPRHLTPKERFGIPDHPYQP